jgi:hypothetical protein
MTLALRQQAYIRHFRVYLRALRAHAKRRGDARVVELIDETRRRK